MSLSAFAQPAAERETPEEPAPAPDEAPPAAPETPPESGEQNPGDGAQEAPDDVAGDAPAQTPETRAEKAPAEASPAPLEETEDESTQEQGPDEQGPEAPDQDRSAPPQSDSAEEEVVVQAGPGAAADWNDADEEVVVSAGGAEPVTDEAADPVQSDPEEDEVVLVTSTRTSQLAGAVTVINERELARTELDDAGSLLRTVPGVMVRDEDGIGLRPNISIRGTSPDRSKKVTLMEDGILFGPAPYSAPAAYYFPLITRMTQVRVVKGPGAIVYGPQTVAGAVDFISRPIPVGPTAYIDTALGEYGYFKTHAYAGASTEQFGILLEGAYLSNTGFKELPDDTNTGSGRGDFVVKANYIVDPTARTQHELSLKLNYAEEASNETYLGLTDADFDQDPNRRYPSSALDRMDSNRTGIALTHEMSRMENRFSWQTTAYRNDTYRSWRKFNRMGAAGGFDVLTNPDTPENAAYYGVLSGELDSSSDLDNLWIGPNAREYVSQGVSSRLRFEGKSGPFLHKFEAGVRLHYDTVKRDHTEDEFEMIDGELFPTGVTTLTTTLNQAETYAAALHVVDAITWKRLTLTPGVRVELIHSELDNLLTDEQSSRFVGEVLPGVGAYFALTNDWGALAGVHRGFSPPAPGSDDSVQSEKSVNYEVGTRYSRRRSKAELIGFFNDYTNLTDICTLSSGCLDADLDRQFDAGEASVFGVEASAEHNLELGELTFPMRGSYTLNYGRFDRDFQSTDPIYGSVSQGDEIPYLPRHQFSAQVALEWRDLGAYTLFTFVAPMREQAGSEDLLDVLSTDPLYTLDVGASYQILEMLQIYVNGRNLLDYQGIMAHRPYGARPNPPRWVQAGLKLHLD